MFQTTSCCEYAVSDTNGAACCRCPEPALPDRPYCARHLATEVEAARLRMERLRAKRKKQDRCRWCGKRSPDRAVCRECRPTAVVRVVRSESLADLYAAKRARQAARTLTAYEAGGTTYNAGVRSRYRGRNKGPPTVAETDDQDFFALDREVALARDTTARWHTEEVQDLPAIQRRAIAADADSHLALALRFIEQIRERAKRRLR